MKNKNTLLLIIAIVIIVLIIVFVIVSNTVKSSKSNINEITETNETLATQEQNGEEYYEENNLEEIDSEVSNNPNYDSTGVSEEDTKKVYDLNLSTLYLESMYCINLYNSRLENIYNEEHNLNQDGNSPDISYTQAAFNCLDPIYINNSNVNKESMKQFAGHYVFIPTSGFRSLQQNQIAILFGYRIDTINNSQEDYGYIVQLNEADNAFSIIPYDFMKNAGITSLQEGNKLNLNNNTIVEKKDNNYYTPSNLDSKKVAMEYIKLFKSTAINKPDLAFTKLTSDYRNKYGSAENFGQYISNYSERFNSLNVSTATEKTEGEYTIYTCYDNNGETFYLKVNNQNAFEYYIALSNITL